MEAAEGCGRGCGRGGLGQAVGGRAPCPQLPRGPGSLPVIHPGALSRVTSCWWSRLRTPRAETGFGGLGQAFSHEETLD